MPQRFIAGVDLGATNVRIAIANEDGEIEARRSSALPEDAPDAVLARVGRTVDELVRGVWPGAAVAAIGVAMPGAVDPLNGTGSSLANLTGWDNVAVAEALGKSRGVPIAVENDANAAAVGEGWLGAAKGALHHAFVAYGTGIGAGIIIDGKLHRGAHRLAGELGFWPLTRTQVRSDDWRDGFEGIAGGAAIARRARDVFGAGAKASEIFDAAAAGDAEAHAWRAALHEFVAMAVAGIVALLDPEIIVFGGGVAMAQGEALLAPVRELVHRRGPSRPKLVLSGLGEDAQILGAMKLAMERLTS